MEPDIHRFLDEDGKLKQWPSKQAMREAALAYLSDQFELNHDYKEQDVNAILSNWHTFGDYFLLRRALVESKYLLRLPDGSKYWKNPDKIKTTE